MRYDSLAGPAARAYLVFFYNTNFLLNITLSFTFLIPLLLAERITGVANSVQLTQQVAVTIYSSFLYAIIYVENDLIDHRRDAESRPFKVSLLSQTGSRRGVTGFLMWLIATLIVAEWLCPALGPSLIGYVVLLLTVGTVHSCCARAKPVTLFIERALRFIAPFFFIYTLLPSFITLIFFLSSAGMYPLVMDGAYLRYLKTKSEWNERLRTRSVSLYAAYYLLYFVGTLTYDRFGSPPAASTHLHTPAPIGALILAPALLIFYFGYQRGTRWMSELLPDGLIPEGNQAYPGERKLSSCQMLVTLVLVGLLTGSAYA